MFSVAPSLTNSSSDGDYPLTNSTDGDYPITNITAASYSLIGSSDALYTNSTSFANFTNDLNISSTESGVNVTNSTEESYSLPVAFDIIPPLIVAIGTIGNILSLCVLSRRKFKNLSVSVYLRGLAIADFFTLLVSNSFVNLLEKTTRNDTRSLQDWACKIFAWLHSSLPWISSWLVVCISVERVIVVYIPHKAKKLCTTTKAYMVTTFVYFFFLLGHIHAFLKYDINAGYCGPVDQVYYISLVGVALALYSVVPLLVIVICNILIVCTLIKMSKVQKTMSHEKSASQNSKNLTVMLVMNCIFFLILTSPYNIVITLYFYSDKAEFDYNIINATYEVRFSNHAINFLLYVICGSLFRKELFRMLTCAKTEPVSSGRSVPSVQSKTEISKV